MAKVNLELPMQTLTVDAVRDFTVCELYYKFKYEDGLYEPILTYDSIKDRFHETLKRVLSYYFFKKQADHVPSLKALINRWERLWFPKDMTSYDMAVDRHRKDRGISLVTMNTNAVNVLESFHSHFADDEGMPIVIDEKTILPVRDDIRLECNIDLILRYPGDLYRVIKWTTKQYDRHPENAFLDFAAMKFAFDHKNNGQRKATYGIFKLTQDGIGYGKHLQPKGSDVDALKYWAMQAVDTDTHLPRRGHTSYCKGCPFDQECADFNEWPKV